MFKRLEGDTAILRINGVYKVADLYEHNGRLFAATSGGYVRLNENGTTSKDKLAIESLQIDTALFRDRFGRLCVTGGGDRAQIPPGNLEPLLLPKD
jgi:hypothetical protein